uniref:Putative udp-glucoronosyl and udp-glucosyl transferase n=1 Tax=Xenopsylla cheopis TaxID=163159 RepID=A0A6M2DU74_XENCH
MPMPSKSHHIWNRSIMVELAKKGYNITALSVDIDPEPTPNLNYIHVEGVYDMVLQLLNSTGNPEDIITHDVTQDIKIFYQFVKILSSIIVETSGYKQLLAYPNNFKFDLVMVDYTGLPDMFGFVHKFGYPPVVGITAFMTPPNTYEVIGNPVVPSLIPFYSSFYSGDMTFWERSMNAYYYALDSYYRRQALHEVDKFVRKHFDKNMPHLADLEKRLDIALVNSHPGMDLPELLLPNTIQVGGLQVKKPKPLHENLDKFFNSAKKGAVYFSLGTNVKYNMFSEEKLQMFVRALAKFPDYHFLWKTERTDLQVSKNVMLTTWASQNDILGHPKTKLFMSHGGLLSSQETTWHGVPTLIIPFFADQFTNAKKAVDAGVAEQILITTVTEEEIVKKLTLMLNDSSYQEKMKQRSLRFRDRPRHPLQEAVWWCEYVLRHKGAPHLKSQAAVMDAVTLFMWDIVLVWLGVVLGIALLVISLLKKLLYPSQNSYRNYKKIN